MLEILEKLFNSRTKVKLLRLFLNNPDEKYSVSEIVKKLKVNPGFVRKEINNLVKINFLARKKKSNKIFYCANRDFIFYKELKQLIFKASPIHSDEVESRVKKLGKIKLALISGTLINSDKCRVDIMIVGENIRKTRLKNFLSNIEADIGKEINYACMGVDEFEYRRSMFDKFINSVFECPHKIIINKLKIEA